MRFSSGCVTAGFRKLHICFAIFLVLVCVGGMAEPLAGESGAATAYVVQQSYLCRIVRPGIRALVLCGQFDERS